MDETAGRTMIEALIAQGAAPRDFRYGIARKLRGTRGEVAKGEPALLEADRLIAEYASDALATTRRDDEAAAQEHLARERRWRRDHRDDYRSYDYEEE